jgi:hypothetical protein
MPVARFRRDEGSILPLIIGGCALALALILGVSTVTSLYVERKRLLALADGAALVAAQSFDLSQPLKLSTGRVLTPQLSASSVFVGAKTYLSALTPSSLHGATLLSVSTSDARTAVVRVGAPWHPPVVSYFFPNGFPLEAEASARSVFTG